MRDPRLRGLPPAAPEDRAWLSIAAGHHDKCWTPSKGQDVLWAACTGSAELDPASHEVRWGDAGEPLTLTEFQLLGRLMSAPGDVVRRHDLIATGWPHGAYVSENTLDSYLPHTAPGRSRRRRRPTTERPPHEPLP